ncbi:MAG: chloride channel protein [Bacillota bacterium]
MFARESSQIHRIGQAMTARGPLGVVAMALGVGVGGAVASVLFVWAIQGVSFLAESLVDRMGWVGLIGAAALGGLAVGLLVYFFAREAKGHGVPEVMAAIALRGGRIRPRVVAVKGIASAITIATGGSAGREGPIVQVGAALGSTIGQWFKVSESNLKTLVACGAAAGIAATFNAPIGGVFFAMEVILGDWDGARFGLITLSSVAAAVLAHSMLGDHPALAELSYTLRSGWELWFYALLGVLIMLAAQLYTRVLYFAEDTFDGIKRVPEWVKPAVGGVLFAVLGLLVPATLGRGEDIVHALLSGHMPEQVASWSALAPALILFLMALGKILSTSITIGSGGSGGIFFPGLFIGAAFGGSFGHVVHSLAPGITAAPGAYALVGMGAFFAGMTHAPITAIVMLFEMTRDYRIILPLMLTCAIAAALSRWVHPESIYTLKLVRQGIRLRRGREVGALQSLTARDVMTTRVDVVRESDTIADVIAFMQKTHHTGFPVVDEEERLVGIISLSDIRRTPLEGRLERRVSSVMTRPVVAVPPHANLEEVTQIMTRRDIGRVPVIDPDGDDRLLGLITRSNILNAYNTRLLEREAQA